METKVRVVLRRYPAFTYDAALDAYAADPPPLAESGYCPVATCWGCDIETSFGVLGGSAWKAGLGTLAVTFRRDADLAP